jgi:hypothetical protein
VILGLAVFFAAVFFFAVAIVLKFKILSKKPEKRGLLPAFLLERRVQIYDLARGLIVKTTIISVNKRCFKSYPWPSSLI